MQSLPPPLVLAPAVDGFVIGAGFVPDIEVENRQLDQVEELVELAVVEQVQEPGQLRFG